MAANLGARRASCNCCYIVDEVALLELVAVRERLLNVLRNDSTDVIITAGYTAHRLVSADLIAAAVVEGA